MNDVELRQILATADSAHAPRAVEAPSVERLATQWRRRQRRRVALTTLLPVFIVAVAFVWRNGRDGVPVNENIPFAKATVDSGSSLPIVDGPSVAKVDPQALQQELAALDREAELSLRHSEQPGICLKLRKPVWRLSVSLQARLQSAPEPEKFN